MTSVDVEREAEAFFAKWDEVWPPASGARLFASPDEWPALRARFGVLFEIAEVCWILRDATVRAHKLAWWQEEIDLHRTGQARHPLLRAAPTALIPPHGAAQALSSWQSGAPEQVAMSSERIRQLAAHPGDLPVVEGATENVLMAMYLLCLREGQTSALAQAPLDLRARLAVGSNPTETQCVQLAQALAAHWRAELGKSLPKFARSDWQGRRGLRVLDRAAWRLIDALARGRAVPDWNWRATLSAWWHVVGLR